MSGEPVSSRPAAFLDRDGVLNADHGYVWRPADFEWLPGVPAALGELQRLGYALVVITNQSGVGRGFYSEDDVRALHAHMTATLAARGIHLAGVYFCPHHPEASVARYRRRCDCRKPAPGMIRTAIDELALDPEQSILVGDKASDIDAGRAAGIARLFHVTTAAPAPGAEAVTDLGAVASALAAAQKL